MQTPAPSTQQASQSEIRKAARHGMSWPLQWGGAGPGGDPAKDLHLHGLWYVIRHVFSRGNHVKHVDDTHTHTRITPTQTSY